MATGIQEIVVLIVMIIFIIHNDIISNKIFNHVQFKININELLNNVILCYNVTTTGYPYPYENNINVYNDFRKIKD